MIVVMSASSISVLSVEILVSKFWSFFTIKGTLMASLCLVTIA